MTTRMMNYGGNDSGVSDFVVCLSTSLLYLDLQVMSLPFKKPKQKYWLKETELLLRLPLKLWMWMKMDGNSLILAALVNGQLIAINIFGNCQCKMLLR